MKLSACQKKTVEHQFDHFCKRVLSNEAKDSKREIRLRDKHEINFSDVPSYIIDNLSVTDEYNFNLEHFEVLGFEVSVRDESIANALASFTQKIAISYFYPILSD